MRPAARIAGWVAAAVAAAALGLAALLLVPRIQRALLRRALVAAGATTVDLGNLHAGPFGAASDRIDVAIGGLRVTGRSIVVRLRPARLLSRRHFSLTELSGRQLEVSWDLAPAPAGPAAGPAPGPAPASPWSETLAALALDGVDLQGRLTIHRGPEVVQEADWRLSGGGLAAGSAGDFTYDVSWRGRGALAGVNIGSAGKIRLQQGAAGAPGRLAAAVEAAFTVRGLAALRPEAAPLGEVHGEVEAEVQGGDIPWALSQARVTLGGGDGKSSAELSLAGSLPLLPRPGFGSQTLAFRFDHFPLAWANPWLAQAKFVLPQGEINGRGTLAVAGATPVLQSLSLTAAGANPAVPVLSVTLDHPLRLSAAEISSLSAGTADGDLASIRVQDLPLDWISKFLPTGDAVEGRLAEGASVLRTVKGQGLVLAATVPWRSQDFRFLVGDREAFRGDMRVLPQLAYGPGEQAVRLAQFDGTDRDGNRLQADIGVTRRERDGRLSADLRFLLDLPALPHSRETFGPLRVRFASTAQIHLGDSRGALSALSLQVEDRGGHPLVKIQAAEPVRVERTPAAEWLLSSADPLQFETAALPLAWLNPYLAPEHVVLGGSLQPAAMKLWLSPRQAKVASAGAISVQDFRFEREGELLLDQGLLNFATELQLDLTHSLLPKLKLNYTASVAVREGLAAAGGVNVAQFKTRLGFSGDEKASHLTDAGGAIWADLGALGRLPLFSGAHLPGRGELTVLLSNVPERRDAIAVEVKAEHVAGRDGRAVPDLEISGRAHVDPGARTAALRIEALLHSSPRPTDANFTLKVDNQDLAVLDSTSAWKSTYVDFDAIRAFLGAFTPAPAAARKPARAAPAAVSGTAPVTPAAPGSQPEPVWGNLRGKFQLDIAALSFDGYLLQNLSGQLGVTATSFALSSLSGDLLGAHWSAAVTADFHPGDSAGDHRLSAQFTLRRLDVAHILSRAFPNDVARIDAPLDVALSVSSKANRLDDLLANTAGNFTLYANSGKVRLSLPGQEMRSSMTLLGTITFSPELRALSRLMKSLSEMPLNRFQASGHLAPDGRLSLENLHIQAPQLKLDISGTIPDAKSSSLVAQPLAARATLAAHGDMAIILGGMKLLGPPAADGFQPVTEPFAVGGTVGDPDVQQLYDVLARGVSGSSGTWRILMKKLQEKIPRPAAN